MLTVNLMNSCSEQPCKTDADVIRALDTAHISPIDYPLVHQWRNTILSYPEHIRNGLVLCCTHKFLCQCLYYLLLLVLPPVLFYSKVLVFVLHLNIIVCSLKQQAYRACEGRCLTVCNWLLCCLSCRTVDTHIMHLVHLSIHLACPF